MEPDPPGHHLPHAAESPPPMSTPQEIDQILEAAVNACDALLGFARESESAHWQLMLADQTWIDLRLEGQHLVSFSADIGRVGDEQATAPLNDLMLRFAHFKPGVSFSLDEDGVREYRQCLSLDDPVHERLQHELLGFASQAQAWRQIVASPHQEGPLPLPDGSASLMAWPLRG
jgi:hypothetical protein